ncbi:MAG: CDP-alcohol phosphatidyltransferase family protein [Clostridia bacterium]|nr:CDP-alcohol phosphatidyltransferase family protein [Clostridia bacterium]
MFIGYYSLANTLTLFGLISAITSCFLAANGNFKFAIYMLFVACLCDCFDGKLARSKPNRTPAEKFYGVQLDSLCDVISFGVTPCYIAFSFGFDGWLDVVIYCLFIACGATRLAYFNTLSNEHPGKMMKSFRGVPIPMSTMIITVLFLLTTFIDPQVTVWLFRIGLLGLGIAFVLNIKIKKPTMKNGAILLGAQIIILIILLIAGDCRAPIA